MTAEGVGTGHVARRGRIAETVSSLPPSGIREFFELLDHTEGPIRRAICLGAYAGLRVAEAASLDWTDVDAGPDGRIYALDTLGDRLLVLDAGGTELGFVATPKDAWKVD